MPLAEIHESVIEVNATFREKAQMSQIPGAKWKNEKWILPLTWASCMALRGSFPTTLEIGQWLQAWAQLERELVDIREDMREQDPNAYPFAYQYIASEFMDHNNVLLADEMGLGKSKEVIDTIVRQAIHESPSKLEQSILIVCPNTLKYVWKDEWTKWAPAWNVYVVDGNLPKKRKILEKECGVFIINYESLRSLSRLAAYGSIHLTDKEKTVGPLNRDWDLVVADEAHKIKDHKAKQTRALWAVGATAKQRIAMTGTPIANSPVDLWSIMHFVEPQDWPSRTKFIDRYCLTNYNFFGGLEVVGLNPAMEKEFFNILNPHFLRRTKAEVLKSLPEKTYQVRYVDMTPKQSRAYNSMKSSMIAELESGVMFTTNPMIKVERLAQIASAMPVINEDGGLIAFEDPSCKVDVVKEILDEAPGDPLVVYAVNKGLVHLVVESLRKDGIETVRITGEDSAQDRGEAVRQFQAGEAQVIVLTTGAGSEGVTLTAANRTVFIQHPWSMLQYQQAQDRTHRQGQTRGVQIIDVISRGTVEQLVLETLGDKEVSLQELCKDPLWMERILK